ncbi:MAG TPA: NAD(P)-dependent oxidoreductase [Paludibaculum sp.]|jgi:3-hydroxyisobutyrate dehydrogenase/2-hydroxy-3-oxopropionate reductase
MANLGFLGLGIMGYPMARHLLAAGHRVALWSNTAAKAVELAAAGDGLVCATPKEVAANADIIFLCVGDTDMSAKVTLGEDGLIEGVAAGAVIVDCSTVSVAYARRAGETLAAKGASFLDAPVTGSKPGAEGATLTFMVGGDQSVYEKVKPFMELMGKRFYYCGGPGLGLQAKLTQNLILSNLLQAFNEGLVLSTKGGVDPELMLDILENSAARSGLISFKAPFVFRRDFSTNFSVRWVHKDIGLMLESANELDVPLPLTALTQQLYRAAIAEGHADEDFCSSIKVLERMAGVEVKSAYKKL